MFFTYCIFDSLQKSVVMLNMLQFILGVGSSVDHATRLTHGGSKMFLTSVLQLEEKKKSLSKHITVSSTFSSCKFVHSFKFVLIFFFFYAGTGEILSESLVTLSSSLSAQTRWNEKSPKHAIVMKEVKLPLWTVEKKSRFFSWTHSSKKQ